MKAPKVGLGKILILSVAIFSVGYQTKSLAAGSKQAKQLAEQVLEATSESRVVHNMSSGAGEELLKTGKLSASLESSDLEDVGAGNCPIEQDIPVVNISDPKSTDDTRFNTTIELRVVAINGFNLLNGTRVPYENAVFSSYERYFAQADFNKVKGMSVSAATDFIMKQRKLSESHRQELSDALYLERIIAASPSGRVAIYKEMGKKMSFDDQIRFISKIGGAMRDNYDHDRADMALDANTVAQCDGIISNLASSNPMGVCRDIVMCQAAILTEMGNKDNVYAASYPTPGNYHVTLMVTDPKNRNKVHKISYSMDSVEETKTGSAAISQDESPDIGSLVRVWKPKKTSDGKYIGTYAGAIPSELGLLLEEETSPNPNDSTGGGKFDPFTTRTYNVIHVGGNYGPVGARVFAAKLSNGDLVYGVGVHASWGKVPDMKGKDVYQGLETNGHVGLAYAHRETVRIGTNADNQKVNAPYNLNNLYLGVHQRVGVPLKVSEHWIIRPYGDIHFQAETINGGPEEKKDKWTGDGNLTANLGASIEYNKDDWSAKLHAHTQLTLGLDDLRGLLGANVGIYSNFTEIGLDVSKQLNANARLNASFICAFREYGDTCGIMGGAVIKDGKNTHMFNAGIIAPVSRAAQPWMPGGARTQVQIGYNFLHQMNESTSVGFNLGYSQSLEDNVYNVNSGLVLKF